MTRTITIWACWIVGVLFFAWASYWAPGGGRAGELSAPEFFLSLLALVHLVVGAVLTCMSLGEQADWLD